MTKVPAPEIWKPLKGFQETHEISNYGNIRSKTRQTSYINQSGNLVYYTLFSKPIKINTNGTPAFRIAKPGKSGVYFRVEDEVVRHFGQNHYYNMKFLGVASDRGRHSDRRRAEKEEMIDLDEIVAMVKPSHPLEEKLKAYADEIDGGSFKPTKEIRSNDIVDTNPADLATALEIIKSLVQLLGAK